MHPPRASARRWSAPCLKSGGPLRLIPGPWRCIPRGGFYLKSPPPLPLPVNISHHYGRPGAGLRLLPALAAASSLRGLATPLSRRVISLSLCPPVWGGQPAAGRRRARAGLALWALLATRQSSSRWRGRPCVGCGLPAPPPACARDPSPAAGVRRVAVGPWRDRVRCWPWRGGPAHPRRCVRGHSRARRRRLFIKPRRRSGLVKTPRVDTPASPDFAGPQSSIQWPPCMPGRPPAPRGRRWRPSAPPATPGQRAAPGARAPRPRTVGAPERSARGAAKAAAGPQPSGAARGALSAVGGAAAAVAARAAAAVAPRPRARAACAPPRRRAGACCAAAPTPLPHLPAPAQPPPRRPRCRCRRSRCRSTRSRT